MNTTDSQPTNVVSQATLEGAFLLAYHDARGDSNRILNREDFRKGWNQCLVAFGVELQVPEKVWEKYMDTVKLAKANRRGQ